MYYFVLEFLKLGGLYKVLYREVSSQGPNPYPFVYHFDRKDTPLIYLLLKKGTPFTYLLKNTAPFSKPLEWS